MTAGPTRSEIGDTSFNQFINDASYFKTKQADTFWGCPGCSQTQGADPMNLENRLKAGKRPVFRGIIPAIRLGLAARQALRDDTGYRHKDDVSKITDGASKTLLAADKWVHNSLYLGDTNGQADDAGWSDGWDFDGLRSTLTQAAFRTMTIHARQYPVPTSEITRSARHIRAASTRLFADGSVTDRFRRRFGNVQPPREPLGWRNGHPELPIWHFDAGFACRRKIYGKSDHYLTICDISILDSEYGDEALQKLRLKLGQVFS